MIDIGWAAADGGEAKSARLDAGASSRPLFDAFDAIAECVQILDSEGRIVLMNPAARAAFETPDIDACLERDTATWVGRDCAALWPEVSRAVLSEALRAASHGANAAISACSFPADGIPRHWEVTFTPLKIAAGGVGPIAAGGVGPIAAGAMTHIVAIARDVTAHKERERALRSRLARREAELAALSARLAAESERLARLRAALRRSDQLRLIGGLTRAFAEDGAAIVTAFGHASGALLRRIWPERGAAARERAARRVVQLFDLARQDSGIAENIDPALLIDDCAELLSWLLGPTRRVEIEHAAACWPVVIRAEALRTVMLRLAEDVRDAMPGGGDVRVRVDNCPVDQRPEILPDRHYARITMTRLDRHAPTDRPGAAGPLPFPEGWEKLEPPPGLRAAASFVKASAGALAVARSGAFWTSVTLLLPRAGMRGVLASMPDTVIGARADGAARVLLVDRDPATRARVGATLRAGGYAVVEAASAEMALGAAGAAAPIDLIVADLATSRRSGFDLVSQIRRRRADLPVIYLADGVEPDRPIGDVVLRKPADDGVLARAVLEQLGRIPAMLLTPPALHAAERLRARMRDPAMRDVFDHWYVASRAAGRLPSLADGAVLTLVGDDRSVVLEVDRRDGACRFRVARIGAALTARLGRDMTGDVLTATGEDVLGSIQSAYRRCLTGAAHFDYARMTIGPGPCLLIERLILPVSQDSRTVTHLVGFIEMSEQEAGTG